jgi:hypothetical protein
MPLSGALGLGCGPFPRLGMAGLAGGLIGAFAIGAIIAVGRVLLGHAGLSLRRAARRSRTLTRSILRVGLVAPLTAVQSVIMAAARTGGAH